MKNTEKKDQWLFIIQAAVEYLIAILVGSSFLATLTKEQLGMSDGLTGILSSIISLGCLFQLFSMVFRQKQVKTFVVILSVVNQLLFLFLYLIPIIPLTSAAKSVIFVVVIILAYLIYNIAHPKKVAWLMSLISDNKRGSFTANKEIVSLIVGTLFTFLMGSMFDHFKAVGEVRTALILAAITIFVLTVSHTLILILTREKAEDDRAAVAARRSNLRESFFAILKNKMLRRVIVVRILYNIAHYAAMPFYGAYQIGDLGMSLQLISILTMVGSVARILVSRFWGRYADRKSFAAMVEKCFLSLGLAYVAVTFAVPANGVWMFALYYVFNGIAMGGINSALINLVFDYVPHENRSDSLAISQAIAGAVGFLTTLCMSPLVTSIQSNGNTLLGFSIYAQQAVSAISVAFTLGLVLFVRFALVGATRHKNSK